MPLSQTAKDDIMDSVWMELERMFTVLTNQTSPDESLFLLDVEAAIRKALKQFAKAPA